MKIGIMSMQRIENYGSFFQAYSLKKIIESLGHEVFFVDYRIGRTVDYSLKDFFKECFDKIRKDRLSRLVINICKGRPLNIYVPAPESRFKKSLQKLGVSSEYKYHTKVDVLIIGSDEVFNCLQKNPDVGFSLELFGKNHRAQRLISYAASFGNTTLSRLEYYHKTVILSKYLNRFNAISIRDNNSLQIVSSLSNISPIKHLDPVLVGEIEKEQWSSKAYNESLVNNEKYIAVYAYPNRIRPSEGEAILALAQSRGLKVCSLNGHQVFCSSIAACSPEEIIPFFQNSSFVVTDTFHGVIFSLINHIPFAVFCRTPKDEEYSNSNKILDLLETFDLSSRLVNENNDLQSIFEKKIDFERIDNIRRKERVRSIAYLKEQI